jgi:catechol 2,3-dioxygenase-like lactoylglutathione lyase family enzyme
MFDVEKAREFYLDWLGFTVVFEHRFGPDLPLFMAVGRAGLQLYLSEHHGDSSPGAHIHVETTGLDALHAELSAKRYRYGRPGIETQPWGARELTAHDPFGNRITFSERSAT